MQHLMVMLRYDAYTVEAPLTDTLVSGQLWLWPPSQNPILLNSHANSVFAHSRKWPAPVTDSFLRAKGVCLLEL